MKILLLFLIIAGIYSCTTKIYLVRHAEKANNTSNADLKTPEGFARAQALKDSLKSISINAVYSTNIPRTIHTGEPTATNHNIRVTVYSNGDSLLEKLITKKNKRFLVVGHSNTLPEMIRNIGLDPGFAGNIPDNDFDNLFIITVRWNLGSVRRTILKKTYGSISP